MRTYKRKTNRSITTKDELDAAADKVMSGLLSLRKAANAFNINFMTLHRYVKKLKAAKEGNIDPVRIQVGYAKPRKLFNQDQEKELVDYMLNCSKIFFGLNTIEARHLAYNYAKKNGLVVPQNWDEAKKASKDWLLSFMKRNPMLSIRTPEPTSLSRMTSFNRHNVSEFFNNLGELYEKYKFESQDVWNIDETGVTTVQKPSKIIASKGIKQVGAATSGERGNLVTVVCAVSASGNSVPPLFVFPRKYFKDYFIVDGPPGSIGAANPSGWVTKDEFLLFIKHFVHHTRCSKERPTLIVLDNHNSHMGLNMIDYCRDNGVILLSFPPHTSHKLQPLDKSVYGPFKTYYNSAADGWMKSNPGKTMLIYNIPTIVKLALQNAATPKNIISGFQATGVWPFNRDIFTDADFSASFVTDRPMPNDTASPDLNEHLNQNEHSSSPGLSTSKEREITNEELELENVAIPSTSAENPSEKIHFRPEQIRPYPKAAARVKKVTKRRKIKSAILTSSPMKKILQEEQRKRNEKTKKKSTVNVSKNKSASSIAKPRRQTRKRKESSASSSDKENENCVCLKCLMPWSESKSGQEWVQCTQCKRWAHAKCAKNKVFYVCDNCNSDFY